MGQGGLGDVEQGAIRGDGEGARERVVVFHPGDLGLWVACEGWKVGFGLCVKFFHV